ncbi:RNA-directed DNA polymerase, eukaryota [Tanacetum coccineum]|uniref:RNA-directed DNA polymerase, eukaryota n=1 Tax=Tanacetum coccineum TaxID=301880 RepID=A0ABQ5FRT8_9ASTR
MKTSCRGKCPMQSVGEDDFLAVMGKWNGVEGVVGLLNIYGPRDKYQWARDFNEVRCIEDRLNSDLNYISARRYNDFIRLEQLVDIPIGGKWYTRISDDVMKFSKLDKFLVSKGFHDLWLELSVVALDRKLLDHCPIMLRDKVMNFGPKPFRVFNIWFKEKGAENVVIRGWNKPVATSIPDRIFRDKLKNVKELKKWSRENFGGFDREIENFKKEAKAEAGRLDEKFTEGEVWMAVKNCGSSKAQNPLVPTAAEGINVATEEAVSNGVLKGVSVGRDEVTVSHFQYVDDTVFFGEWSHRNGKNLMGSGVIEMAKACHVMFR